jgi:hypothetical protein
MKKILSILAFISLLPLLKGQDLNKNLESGDNIFAVFTTVDGTKMTAYKNPIDENSPNKKNRAIKGDWEWKKDFLQYFDNNGNLQKIESSKILDYKISGYENFREYKSPSKKSKEKYLTVIAENDIYIMANDYQPGHQIYIFKKFNNEVVVKAARHSITQKKDEKLLSTTIMTYFSDCPELIEKLNKNIKEAKYTAGVDQRSGTFYTFESFTKDIKNHQCR